VLSPRANADLSCWKVINSLPQNGKCVFFSRKKNSIYNLSPFKGKCFLTPSREMGGQIIDQYILWKCHIKSFTEGGLGQEMVG
jgi:hypothetical protein